MELFHTSPSKITEINELGIFGSNLFFSTETYHTVSCDVFTYKINLDDDDIIESGQLFYHKDSAKLDSIIKEVMNLINCDEEEAEKQLEQSDEAEYTDTDNNWEIQALSAKAAKLLGFRAVSMQDEQGTCYMIDMLKKESDLVEVK